MSVLKQARRKAAGIIRSNFSPQSGLDQIALLGGSTAARAVRGHAAVDRLSDVEFAVSSQWGEDGIIEWLVHHHGDLPESFVEFGVENYRESNTRFLLQSRNWRGLVIDGSAEHVAYIRQDRVSWRHDLTAVAAFITKENIDELIAGAGFAGELGILSVDIDGNDYWVWEAISCVRPHIVIAEYNSAFGDLLPLTIPYRPDFTRTGAHHSNLYYGASIRALERLANERGFVLVGTNLAGSNVFFVRQDRTDMIDRVRDRGDRPSRFREARGEDGRVTLTPPADRAALIGDMAVVDIRTATTQPLAQCGPLFSERWTALLRGQQAKPV